MSKRVFGSVNLTFTGTADTTNLADSTFMCLQGNQATDRYEVEEIYMAGTASTSNVAMMMFARNSQVGGTTTLVAPHGDGPLEPQAAALTNAPKAYNIHTTTFAQRSVGVVVPRLNLAFNAFGGIVRWVAAPYERFVIYGTAANVGEASLSNYTGGGTNPTASAHIVYEVI